MPIIFACALQSHWSVVAVLWKHANIVHVNVVLCKSLCSSPSKEVLQYPTFVAMIRNVAVFVMADTGSSSGVTFRPMNNPRGTPFQSDLPDVQGVQHVSHAL